MLLQLTAANIECKSTFEQTPGGRVKNDHVRANRTEPPPPSPSPYHPTPPSTPNIYLARPTDECFAHSFYVRLHVNTTKKFKPLLNSFIFYSPLLNDFTWMTDD